MIGSKIRVELEDYGQMPAEDFWILASEASAYRMQMKFEHEEDEKDQDLSFAQLVARADEEPIVLRQLGRHLFTNGYAGQDRTVMRELAALLGAQETHPEWISKEAFDYEERYLTSGIPFLPNLPFFKTGAEGKEVTEWIIAEIQTFQIQYPQMEELSDRYLAQIIWPKLAEEFPAFIVAEAPDYVKFPTLELLQSFAEPQKTRLRLAVERYAKEDLPNRDQAIYWLRGNLTGETLREIERVRREERNQIEYDEQLQKEQRVALKAAEAGEYQATIPFVLDKLIRAGEFDRAFAIVTALTSNNPGLNSFYSAQANLKPGQSFEDFQLDLTLFMIDRYVKLNEIMLATKEKMEKFRFDTAQQVAWKAESLGFRRDYLTPTVYAEWNPLLVEMNKDPFFAVESGESIDDTLVRWTDERANYIAFQLYLYDYAQDRGWSLTRTGGALIRGRDEYEPHAMEVLDAKHIDMSGGNGQFMDSEVVRTLLPLAATRIYDFEKGKIKIDREFLIDLRERYPEDLALIAQTGVLLEPDHVEFVNRYLEEGHDWSVRNGQDKQKVYDAINEAEVFFISTPVSGWTEEKMAWAAGVFAMGKALQGQRVIDELYRLSELILSRNSDLQILWESENVLALSQAKGFVKGHVKKYQIDWILNQLRTYDIRIDSGEALTCGPDGQPFDQGLDTDFDYDPEGFDLNGNQTTVDDFVDWNDFVTGGAVMSHENDGADPFNDGASWLVQEKEK